MLELNDIKKDYADIDNYDFYIRFVKALSDLEELQSSLHDQSNSMELTENDKNVIAEKAFEFGFSNWDAITEFVINFGIKKLLSNRTFSPNIVISFAGQIDENIFSFFSIFKLKSLNRTFSAKPNFSSAPSIQR